MLNRTRLNILIAAIIAVNIGLVVFLVYRMADQKRAFLSLRSEDAFLFLEGLSHNLETATVMQHELKQQLVNQLDMAADILAPRLDQIQASPSLLETLLQRYQLWKIVILDPSGKLAWSSKGGFGRQADPALLRVCRGDQARYVIGLRENYRRTGYRLGLARHLDAGGALVLIMDADRLHKILSQTTFSHVLSHVRNYEGLEFVRFETLDAVLYDSERTEGQTLSLAPAGEDPDVLEAIFANEPFTRDLTVNGQTMLEVVWPVYVNNIFQGVVRIGLSLDYVRLLDTTTRWLTLMLLGMIATLDLLMVLAWRQNRRLNLEARKYQAVMERIQDGVLIREADGTWVGNESVRKLLGPEPCSMLCEAPMGLSRLPIEDRIFLVLRNRVETTDIFIVRDVTVEEMAENSRQREERLFSTGRLASSFAHEIRNPLNTISMIFQQVMQADGVPDPERDLLVLAEEEVQRLNGFVEEFMKVARDPDIHPVTDPAPPLLKEVVSLYEPRVSKTGIQLMVEHEPDLLWRVDRDRMKGVLVNLIENAIDAGATRIRLRLRDAESYLRLEVEDDGTGMGPEQLEQAFDLYYTTKSNGTGLGLAYVQRIVAAHGGIIDVTSQQGEGTRFTLLIPKGETA